MSRRTSELLRPTVHDYFGIDLKIIWRIINEDLRVFKAQLQ